mgnify:CR=1 FL=1
MVHWPLLDMRWTSQCIHLLVRRTKTMVTWFIILTMIARYTIHLVIYYLTDIVL